MDLAEWRRKRERIKARNRDAEPETLAPPEAFPDHRSDKAFLETFLPKHGPEDLGRKSKAVRIRLIRSCAGWERTPTNAEFHDALRAEKPSARQKAILHTWLSEATMEELWTAEMEGAYTWPELVRALHRAGLQDMHRCAELNRMV